MNKNYWEKAILINTMPRSGSNILWNIIGSSPDVDMTKHEFSEFTGLHNNPFHKYLLRLNALWPIPLTYGPFLIDSIRQSVRARGEDSTASKKAVSFKLMVAESRFNKIVQPLFKDTKVIFLNRSAAGLCDSYYRRGLSAEEAGQNYKAFLTKIHAYNKTYKNGMFVQFEELCSNFTNVVNQIYAFLDISKPTDGTYRYGQKKYGPGNEEAAKGPRDPVVHLTPEAYQTELKPKSEKEYLENIPDTYWDKFNQIIKLTQAG